MELIKHQRTYHQTAIAILDEIVPELEIVIGIFHYYLNSLLLFNIF